MSRTIDKSFEQCLIMISETKLIHDEEKYNTLLWLTQNVGQTDWLLNKLKENEAGRMHQLMERLSREVNFYHCDDNSQKIFYYSDIPPDTSLSVGTQHNDVFEVKPPLKVALHLPPDVLVGNKPDNHAEWCCEDGHDGGMDGRIRQLVWENQRMANEMTTLEFRKKKCKKEIESIEAGFESLVEEQMSKIAPLERI